MRLLNTTTLEFGEFFDDEIPEYLILSHRWGKDEVSYQQMESGNVPNGQGSDKIRGFCQLAAQKWVEWAWVDTCCIDKKSSAELTEAINSMKRWYSNAQECLVYLSDVQKGDPAQSIQGSEWFRRGWTVQELLAPQQAIFFDKQWSQLGTRFELRDDISVAARIDSEFLERGKWSNTSVACKMSWFAHRQTSRIEDMAYSMLGIFDINMPLIYGEGWKSFKRLQVEIVNSTNDESIFAWDPWDGSSRFMPMLAPHPKWFESFGEVTWTRSARRNRRPPYTATNKALEISIRSADFNLSLDSISTLPYRDFLYNFSHRRHQFSLLRLDCRDADGDALCILLRRWCMEPLTTRGSSIDSRGDWDRVRLSPFEAPRIFNMAENEEIFQAIPLTLIADIE